MNTEQHRIASRVHAVLRRTIRLIGRGRDGHYGVDFTGSDGRVDIYGPSARVKTALIALGGDVDPSEDIRVETGMGAPFVIRRYYTPCGKSLCEARFTDDGYGGATLWYYTTNPANAAIITDMD